MCKTHKPIKYSLGTVALKFSAPADLTIFPDEFPKGKEEKIRSALETSEFKFFAPKSVITHSFKKPEKRPNAMISLIFVVIVCLTIGAFALIIFNHYNAKLFGFTTPGLGMMGVLAGFVLVLCNFYLWVVV